MVEEYNLETNVVVRRAWKVTKKFGSQPKWEVEIGDPEPCFQEDMENSGIKESSTAVSKQSIQNITNFFYVWIKKIITF